MPVARVVKLVDTLGSGSSGRKAVLVQVQFRAEKKPSTFMVLGFFFFQIRNWT